MMREVPINYMLIILAGVASMVVGFLWYSPMLFGNAWMKLSGFTKESIQKAKKDMNRMYTISFIVSLLMAYVLQHSSVFAGEYFNMKGIPVGIMTAFWSWAGFVMPVQLTSWLFDKKPLKLFLINTGYQLASLMAMAIILTAW